MALRSRRQADDGPHCIAEQKAAPPKAREDERKMSDESFQLEWKPDKSYNDFLVEVTRKEKINGGDDESYESPWE